MAADKATDPHIKHHRSTYTGFLAVTKWSVIFIAVVLIGLFAFVFSK